MTKGKFEELMSNINANEIIEKYNEDFDYIGIRLQGVPFELGEMNHNSISYYGNDDYCTNEELDGVSVTDMRDFDFFATGEYLAHGDHVAIICGCSASSGDDIGERVIRDAEVVEIIC